MQELQQTKPRAIDASQVNGWGVDADPENDPTFPMKTHVDGEHKPYTGHRPSRPDQQSVSVEVLHSNERPNVSAVFGTPVPPSGVSGMIRRAAFNFSENSYGHWLPLMLADRVQMVEGVLDDLAHGHIPNIFSELGWKADWKYNRKAVVTQVVVASGLALGIYALLRSRRNRSAENRSFDDGRSNENAGDTDGSRQMANRRGIDTVRASQTAAMKDRMSTQTGGSTSSTGTSKNIDQPSAGSLQSSMKMNASQSTTMGGSSESSAKTSGSESSSKMGASGSSPKTAASNGSATADQQAERRGEATSQKGSTSAKPKTDQDSARGL